MVRPAIGIATDGAHSMKERLTRFRAVDLSSGVEIFSETIGNQTNSSWVLFIRYVTSLNTRMLRASSIRIAKPQSHG